MSSLHLKYLLLCHNTFLVFRCPAICLSVLSIFLFPWTVWPCLIEKICNCYLPHGKSLHCCLHRWSSQLLYLNQKTNFEKETIVFFPILGISFLYLTSSEFMVLSFVIFFFYISYVKGYISIIFVHIINTLENYSWITQNIFLKRSISLSNEYSAQQQ